MPFFSMFCHVTQLTLGLAVGLGVLASSANATAREPEICAAAGRTLTMSGAEIDRPFLGICFRGANGKPAHWLVAPEYLNLYESRDWKGDITGNRFVVSGSKLNGPYVLDEAQSRQSQPDYEKYGPLHSEVLVFNIRSDGTYVLTETKKTAGTLFGAVLPDAQNPGTWILRSNTPLTTWGITSLEARDSAWKRYIVEGLYYFNGWLNRFRFVAHKLGVFGGGLPMGRALLPDPSLEWVDAKTLEPVGLPGFPAPTKYVHSGTRMVKPKGGSPYPENAWGPEKMDGMTVVRGMQPSGVLAWPASVAYIFMQGSNGLYGVVDRSGAWWIEPRFASAPDQRMLSVPLKSDKYRNFDYSSGELKARACYLLVCRISTNELQWSYGADKPELLETASEWTLPLFSDPDVEMEWLRVTVAVAVVVAGLIIALTPFTTLYHKLRYGPGWGGAIAQGVRSSVKINFTVAFVLVAGFLALLAIVLPVLVPFFVAAGSGSGKHRE